MKVVEFEFAAPFGESIAVKLGGEVVTVEQPNTLMKKMAVLMGNAARVELTSGEEIAVYFGSEQWDVDECRLEMDGLSGVRLSRAQAFDLARVLMAFSVTGEPLSIKHDARNWLLRLERTSAL